MSEINQHLNTINGVCAIIAVCVMIYKSGLRRLALAWAGLLIVVLVVGPMVLGIMAAVQTVGGLGR